MNLLTALHKTEKKTITNAKLEAREFDQLFAQVELDYAKEVLTSVGMREKAKALFVKPTFHECLDPSRIVSLEAIKAVCVKYGLRFLPADKFVGSMDPTAIREAAKFVELRKEHQLPYYNFSIAAPASEFKLRPRPTDPILFVSLGQNMYYVVAKWGKDLSFWNLLKNIPIRNANTLFWTGVFFIALMGLCIFGFLHSSHWTMAIASLIAGVFSLLLTVGFFAMAYGDGDSKDERFSNESDWQSDIK